MVVNVILPAKPALIFKEFVDPDTPEKTSPVGVIKLAKAVAPEPLPPEKETVGVLTYPEPEETSSTAFTKPTALTIALSSFPDFPEPVIGTTFNPISPFGLLR